MRDQKRWMKNWIRALAVGTMIAAAVPLSVMAAEKGWVNEDGVAHYVDSNGSYVKNQWKTSQGVSYYLDENGDLAKNVWVDGTYYAGEDGSMTKDAWIYVDENDGSMKSGWYYLNRNGKVEKNDWKTIGKGKYCFDSDGRMRTGWHYENGDIYYLGNGSEGYTRSGWYFLESDGKKRPAEGSVSKDLSGESEKGRWYYFQSNGKARKGENGAPKETTIDGKKYYFDENGVMLTGWQCVKEKAEPGDGTGISRFVYLGGKEKGMLKGQWFETTEKPWDTKAWSTALNTQAVRKNNTDERKLRSPSSFNDS